MSFTITAPTFAAGGVADRAENRSVENPSVPLSSVGDDDGDIGNAWFGGGKAGNPSGVRVTRAKALGYSAVWRAVNLICNKVAALPFNVYQNLGASGDQGGRKIDREHAAYHVLRRRPNAHMTPVVLKRTLQGHALLRGNGYGYIYRDADARPLEIYPLNPETTFPFRRGGELWYAVEIVAGDGSVEVRKLPAVDVLHIAGLGFDGLVGYDVLKVLAATIGKAIAARDYGARYFSNDTSTRQVLEFPLGMKEATVNAVADKWKSLNSGLENKHKTGILREGVKLNTYSATARDAQLTENYAFDAKDIANVFGLPAHKVGDDSQSSYNSLEQENQAMLDDTVDPWLVTWEEQADEKLLTEAEKKTESHYCKFVRQALARADLAARGSYYVQAVNNGWLSPDEVRDLEEGNPIPGGHGQQYFRSANTIPLASAAPVAGKTDPAPAKPADPAKVDPQSNSIRVALRKAVAKSVGRMVRRLGTHADRAAKKGELAAWLSRELEGHEAAIADELAPLAEAIAAIGNEPPAATTLARMVTLRFRLAMENAKTVEAIEAELPDDVSRTLLPEN